MECYDKGVTFVASADTCAGNKEIRRWQMLLSVFWWVFCICAFGIEFLCLIVALLTALSLELSGYDQRKMRRKPYGTDELGSDRDDY